MKRNQNIPDLNEISDVPELDESASVDDFMKELEAKEKDLHITAETTFIEMAADFEDGELPEYLKTDLASGGQRQVELAYSTAAAPAKSAAEKGLRNAISELQGKLSIMEGERDELLKASQRRSRDFDAYKARTERERRDTFQNQLSNLAIQMLPALDNLSRALHFASDLPEEKRDEFAQFFDGIVIVSQQVNEVLASMGIKPIMSVGKAFNPHLHEAVAIDESENFPPNTVSEELLRGYCLGEKVIRHSMVKVSRPAKPAEAERTDVSPADSDVDFLEVEGPDDPGLDAPVQNTEAE